MPLATLYTPSCMYAKVNLRVRTAILTDGQSSSKVFKCYLSMDQLTGFAVGGIRMWDCGSVYIRNGKRPCC